MKETSFIEQNKGKWVKFEGLLKNDKKNPDELSELFVEITDDFSYARTFYTRRSVRVYLNYLAQRVFTSIYKNRKENFSRIIKFWQDDLPLQVWRSRKALMASLVIFLVAALIGVISTSNDIEFVRVVLGDYYVDMTEENINKGDPMAVYKDDHKTEMFLGITLNNIRVAMYTFVLGILWSAGTVIFLMYNGVMLGTFQYFFFKKGLFLTSFLTIWIHGTLEISSIIIAGGAGITLGSGLLFPKTYSRLQSLQISAKRGLKLLIGTVPIFIVAGFLEGFVTGQYQVLPDAVKAGIIVISAAFILFYFVWYPWRKAKKENFKKALEERPAYHPKQDIEYYKIRSVGEVFNDTFSFYRIHFKNFGKVLLRIVLPLNAFVIGLQYYFMNKQDDHELDFIEILALTFNINFKESFNPYVFVAQVFLLTVNACAVYHCFVLHRQKNPEGNISSHQFLVHKPAHPDSIGMFFRFLRKHFLKVLPIVALLYGAVMLYAEYMALTPDSYAGLGLFAIVALLFIVLFNMFLASIPLSFVIWPLFFVVYEKEGFLKSALKGLKYLKSSWLANIGLCMVLLLICTVFFFIFISPVFFIVNEVIVWHLVTDFENFTTIINFLNTVYYVLFFHLVIPVFFIGFAFQYFTIIEKLEAVDLFKRLEKFGSGNKIYETADEGTF
ncbi:MAG: hypothetical protein COA57_06050 [Flavobacteriales bacterium]|nr:MAG: hypothetical protein COA57_06050 [Flavobacteriales bacterium]